MRYLCLVGFSYAAATVCCAYWLPYGWLLPLGLVLLALGLAFWLLRIKLRSRWLLRGLLCALSAALALGAYALHWRDTVAPARALHESFHEATLELRETPQRDTYSYGALGWLHLKGERISVQCWLDEADGLRPGDVLTGMFQLELPKTEQLELQEPGYLRSCGVYLYCDPVDEYSITRPERLPLRHWPAMLRSRITETCRACFGEGTAPWFIALLTNQNGFLSYADKNDLKLSGLYHVMCTSGMHITVLLGLVTLLCLQNRRLAALIGLPLCLFFWGVAGGTPSVSRAVVMQALLLLAPLLGEDHDTPTAMALALLGMLIVNPDAIAHLGLQLSFLSVAGIALFALPLYQWGMDLRPVHWLQQYPVLRQLSQTVVSSLSTAIGAILLTTPLLSWHYGVVSLIAPIAGLLVIPLVTFCFAVGLPLTLLCTLIPVLQVLAMPVDWAMGAVVTLTRLFADVPVLYVNGPYWAVWLGIVYVLLAVLWLSRPRPAAWMVLGGIGLSFCLALGLQQWELRQLREDFRLTALDVGQGQCLIVELGDAVCVIDCGGTNPDAAGEDCARWLLSHGYGHIDLLALTHYHADHAGGAAQLLSRVEVDALLLPDVPDATGNRAVLEALCENISYVTEDMWMQLGLGKLMAYAPRSESGDNEACAAYLVDMYDTQILITGDMDRETEIRLCKTADLPDVECFVAGHHGSRDANSTTLLERTLPEVVIVSCSDRFGHPHEETLTRYAAIGAAVLRTDERGTITITR